MKETLIMKETEKERYTRLECDVVELQTEGTVLDASGEGTQWD